MFQHQLWCHCKSRDSIQIMTNRATDTWIQNIGIAQAYYSIGYHGCNQICWSLIISLHPVIQKNKHAYLTEKYSTFILPIITRITVEEKGKIIFSSVYHTWPLFCCCLTGQCTVCIHNVSCDIAQFNTMNSTGVHQSWCCEACRQKLKYIPYCCRPVHAS